MLYPTELHAHWSTVWRQQEIAQQSDLKSVPYPNVAS